MKTWIVLALFLLGVTPAFAVPVKVAEAPYNDLALTVQAIETAQQYILLNIYELSSPEIIEALTDRIQAGVHVEILEEGQPAFGMAPAEKRAQQGLANAMASARNRDDHFYVMTSKAGGKRRFRFDHAKYMVTDDQNLLIGSENYSPTGNPKPGKLGNRGWEVLIQDPELATWFKGMFYSDGDTGKGDIVDLMGDRGGSSSETTLGSNAMSFSADLDRLRDLAKAMPVLEADAVSPIVAPNTSLNGLQAIINDAQSSIDIEQMTFDSEWGRPGTKSPLVETVIAAARRGVQVRVLLNDETVFDKPDKPTKHKNEITANLLNKIAKAEGLKMEARIATLAGMHVDYIHNKGVVADGNKTLISSINWDENAIERNREAAVLIQGSDVYNHYEQLFESDWTAGDSLQAE